MKALKKLAQKNKTSYRLYNHEISFLIDFALSIKDYSYVKELVKYKELMEFYKLEYVVKEV